MEARRKYDLEFKQQAVQLSEQDGVTVVHIACELGIDVKLLYRWRSEQHKAGEAAFPGQGHQACEADEIRRLQRELARVQMGPKGFPDILERPWASWHNHRVLRLDL